MSKTVKCPDCGAEVPAGADECPDCGATMPKKNVGKVGEGALAKLLRSIAGAIDEERGVAAGTTAVAELERFTKHVPIAKVDAERRLVYGVVYEPNVPDAHDDVMTATEIEKMAHRFMQNYSRQQAESGTEHLADVGRDQVTIAESFIAPSAFTLGKQAVTKGTWVLVTKVHDDQLWKSVKDGTYTGYSFEGWGRRVPAAA